MPNTYLTQTISSSTGKIFTLSMWIKKSANDSFNQLFHLSSDSNTHKYIDVATKSAYGLDVQLKNGSGGSQVGLFFNSMVSISFENSLLALRAICSPNKVPTPIPEPL